MFSFPAILNSLGDAVGEERGANQPLHCHPVLPGNRKIPCSSKSRTKGQQHPSSPGLLSETNLGTATCPTTIVLHMMERTIRKDRPGKTTVSRKLLCSLKDLQRRTLACVEEFGVFISRVIEEEHDAIEEVGATRGYRGEGAVVRTRLNYVLHFNVLSKAVSSERCVNKLMCYKV